MKFFHLADIHIGKTVNGFSMLEDQKYIFKQILRHVREQQPQAVVIAGDVYDRAVPSADAVKVFDNFLTALSIEKVTVLIVSGNHDSPERLSFGSKIMENQNIYLSGVLDKEVPNVCLGDEYGEVQFYLLPFIRPSSVRRITGSTSDTYDKAFKEVIDLISADIDKNKRNVLIAHQFFVSDHHIPETSESEINPVGGIGNININTTNIASCFDYVALGHIHRQQRIGVKHIRYAGSPLKYSLSEVDHKKSMTVVEMREKGNVEISFIPLRPLHDMRVIRGPIEELMSDEIVSQGNKNDYIFVTLTDNDIIFDVIDKMRSIYPNIMALDFDNNRTSAILDMEKGEKVDDAEPLELFEEFFLMQNGWEMNKRQLDIVKESLSYKNE